MDSFEVLVDSDIFVAGFLPDDLLHSQATAIFKRLGKEERSLVTTSWVITETATVLSNRGGQATARQFLEEMEKTQLPVIHITEELQQEIIRLFKQQEARGTSMVDCGNAVVATRYSIPTVFSFDGFYKRLKLKTVS